jgi:FixJ family two-component response regulator
MTKASALVAIVDDDRRVRQSIQSVLESAGFEAAMFASAEEFLASGAVSRASCIVADMRLPGIDGIELQRRIRQQRPLSPVIFITAHDDEDIRERALRGGAVDFMVKPFDAGELLDCIERTTKAS